MADPAAPWESAPSAPWESKPVKSSPPIASAPTDAPKQEESTADYLKKNTYAGNMITGAQESGVDVMRGARWVGEKLYGPDSHDATERSAFDAADKKLKGQEGSGAGNAIARFAGDPLNYVAGPAIKEAKVGEKLIKSGENLAATQRADFVKDLVSPKKTKAVKEAQVGRTTEKGLLKTKSVEPTPLEKEIAEEVNKLPVHRGQSLQGNYNTIAKAYSAEAERLQASLEKRHVPISMDEVQAASDKMVSDLQKNMYVSGAGEASALKVVSLMQKAVLDTAVKDGEITAANLLQARKDFDAVITEQKTAKIFDPSVDSPASIAVQHVRQAVNDLIESKIPGEYKPSLKKQFLLHRAMDNLEEKAAGEANNAVTRGIDKYGKYIPSKNPVAKAVGAVPVAVGAGAYGAAKALTGATARKVAGHALEGLGGRTADEALGAEVDPLTRAAP